MKLRINGNSLRLRVSRSETAKLHSGERLEETIYFAPNGSAKLTYVLEQKPTVRNTTVRYAENTITVLISAEVAHTWCTTDLVGIEERITLGSLGSLHLLIEKDFACLDRSDEENQDAFANPHAGALC